MEGREEGNKPGGRGVRVGRVERGVGVGKR
jgi:hypothetical protein